MPRNNPFRLLLLIPLLLLLLASPLLAQWEPDVRLTNNSADSQSPSVVVSGSEVHVVWGDLRDGTWENYYKRSTDGGTSWGADLRLTNNDGAHSLNSSVAVSGTRVHVVWTETRDGNPEIYTMRSTDGGTTWGADTRLTSNSADSWNPSVAASGTRVHVVWEEYRDGNQEIYSKRSLDGGTSWGSDTRLTNNSASSLRTSVAASGTRVHAVWYDTRDGNYEIYTKRSTDGGASWGSDTRLTNNPDSSQTSYNSARCIAATGDTVHVVWEEYRDGNNEIYTKRSTDGGATWGADTRLTNNSSNSLLPSVVVSGSNVHVVWQEYRDGNGEIYYKGSTDGGATWGTDTRLTNNSANSHLPSVVASGSNVHVAWNDYRDGNGEIYYKRNPTGNIGVEETAGIRGQGLEVRITAKPNPFTSFTTFPGHEGERFSLYDISGRRVGTYRGDRIGEGLSPGVYFLFSSDNKDKPLRIVKVR